jgi:hypothetical protein
MQAAVPMTRIAYACEMARPLRKALVYRSLCGAIGQSC